MLKKIIYRVFLLLILIIAFNFIYAKWFYEKDIQKHSDIINLVREIPEDADIIYLGESSNITFRSDDLDKRPISDFIGDYYPELKIYDITKPASHAGIYEVLLENIPDDHHIKTIIVTLNLRSFNAQWIYSNLETSLQKSLVLIKPYPPLYNRFMLSFKAYDIKTESERQKQFKTKWKRDKFHLTNDLEFKNVIEWDKWMFHNGIRDENGNVNRAMTELACHYIKGYAFQIDTLYNPRIRDFNRIVEVAGQLGCNLVFNLLAENTEKAKELVGDDLIFMMNENARLLEEYYGRKGVVVVNNLNEVENELYIDQNWTTEHYAEKGRKKIAGNVAKVLKMWHRDQFKDVQYDNNYQTVFFNDCDKDIVWSQMQTITNEAAYSGRKSSKTGNGASFSITLEYPLKVVPDSIKNSLLVECMIFQTSNNLDTKLAFEASGKEFDYFWEGYDIKENLTEINTWELYRKQIPIPDSIKHADLIKIYIYNPSKEIIYVDDFKITIE